MFEIVEDSIKKDITAPVEAGEVLGQAKVYYAGIELLTVNLVAAQTVERSFTGLIMSKISDLVGSTAFMVLTILMFLAAAGYLFMIMSKFYGWDKKIEKTLANKKTQTQKKAPARKTAQPKQKPGDTKK
jgi:D-alanyl-D-alanine carboxypeptidase (penicillin-binding protein 5/6)